MVPRLIVCFDISHTQGTEVVGSAVVFENGEPKKSEYRRFRIRGEWGNDDFRSMAEVVGRYFRRRIEEGLPLPELVVIDGGKGQLSAAVAALEAAGARDVQLCALAKREEEVYRPGRPEPYRLPAQPRGAAAAPAGAERGASVRPRLQSEAAGETHLVERAVGDPGRRPETPAGRCSSRFGSVRALREATADDLAAVPGFSDTLAHTHPRAPERRMTQVRTRFAPSPTGSLHVGNARTAVLNWLIARHHGGAFILRIEDTDAGRNVAGAEGRLMADLRWLGLELGRGPGPGR